MPLHLFFFIAILFFVLGFSWYINYESAFEDLMNQLKLFLILSPLLLLLLVHCLSAGANDNNNNGGGGGGFSLYIPLPERDSLHRAGGSPWGVALLLVFLLYMISYQSSLQERWFPLLAR
ncbi:unnamed protein product [Linum tenue]|uniref:Uncharacterized protein n=1 Tax=Linum tenue TaxID=586396 RepID=A0AAV0JY14_9ROSI|nr:unnamed protein product [Linum tenue]